VSGSSTRLRNFSEYLRRIPAALKMNDHLRFVCVEPAEIEKIEFDKGFQVARK
jgi:hypothetical protein